MSGWRLHSTLAAAVAISSVVLGACEARAPEPLGSERASLSASPDRQAERAGERSAPSPARSDARPSIAVIVVDTVRADAVSAYGSVEGTTPVLDALSEEGTLYTRAFAPSSWTLPSHATLLTGLGVERHGVGVRGREVLDPAFVTIAERLADAGYHTGGFSENLMVSEPFGLTRGFARFRSKPIPLTLDSAEAPYDVVEEIAAWTRQLPDAPFFLFVNLFDAHDPYEVRPENPFLPEGVHVSTARTVEQLSRAGIARSMGICDRLPPPDELAILRGLYLGDVRAADRKLGRVLERLEALERELVTVVVSDHGEHLGEHSLLGHEFTVRNVALHVPLVVRCAPGLAPGRSDALVTLSDVSASILAWAGVDPPEDLDGELLPAPGEPRPDRTLVAFYGDGPWVPPEGVTLHVDLEEEKRASCRPAHRVFGDLHAALRFPFKLISAPGQPPLLFDLSWDPGERSNLAPHQPEIVEELRLALRDFRARTTRATETLDPKTIESLRALGYLD